MRKLINFSSFQIPKQKKWQYDTQNKILTFDGPKNFKNMLRLHEKTMEA